MTDKDKLFMLNKMLQERRIVATTKIGEGLESIVYEGFDHVTNEQVAIKQTREAHINNGNDLIHESREILAQEYALLKHLQKNGFTHSPKRLAFIETSREPLLVMDRLYPAKPLSNKEVANVLASVHAMPLPTFLLRGMEDYNDVNEVIVARLSRRLTVIESFVSLPFSLDQVRPFLVPGQEHEQYCLLHMDVRPQNFLESQDGELFFLDWSNALIGPPLLEFCRMMEYGDFDLALPFEKAAFKTVRALLYRLDTAVMLAIVFYSEQRNEQRFKQQVKRIYNIVGALQEEVGKATVRK
ncbi:phosphotransferase family protein [Shouchella lonarensis]|uniref:Thiamine kinase n=1 Tax=Shouchella lonarensis TaxID=1464122 RepID=A0A1G6M542_9BACI|nr:aminoglycoside phosphotransferase family protein [Shouchella lonarensis]SDC50672.1 Thiamine kinase [Shouchella lonarensis]